MSEEKIVSYKPSLTSFGKLFFRSFLTFSLYHLIRDMAQLMGVHHAGIDVLHTYHAWCGSACDVITLPLDVLGIVGSAIILKRQFWGKWGIALIASIPLWFLFMWLP